MTHTLKTWPEYFELVLNGSKHFELRKADRPFEIGDKLVLQEYQPISNSYTGREIEKVIKFIIYGPGFGLRKGFVCISLGELPD